MPSKINKSDATADLSEEQIADLKEAFAMFDINGDGKQQAAAKSARNLFLENWCTNPGWATRQIYGMGGYFRLSLPPGLSHPPVGGKTAAGAGIYVQFCYC